MVARFKRPFAALTALVDVEGATTRSGLTSEFCNPVPSNERVVVPLWLMGTSEVDITPRTPSGTGGRSQF
jgi:hypothetical protein